MTQILTRPTTLWLLFALFIVETAGFGAIMAIWEFQIIDEMSDPAAIRDHIAAMSETQKTAHAWMTATLDVAYPLTYGALLAGLALQRFHPVLATPAILVIPVDLAEGYVQVTALMGNEAQLWLKAYLTPAKLALFIVAIFIALGALCLLLISRLTNNPPRE